MSTILNEISATTPDQMRLVSTAQSWALNCAAIEYGATASAT